MPDSGAVGLLAQGMGSLSADLDDLDDRDVGDGLALRMRGPLRGGAVDAHDHPRLPDHLLEFDRVEGADALGDLLRLGPRADQREKADEVMRIDAGRCDQPAVLGLEHLEAERVAQHEGPLERPAVQRRDPGPFGGQPVRRQRARGNVVVGEETRPGRNAVHGLAQVDAEFLRLAGALAPDGRGPHAARHRGNRHAGAKPEAALQDRIAPGEQHAPPASSALPPMSRMKSAKTFSIEKSSPVAAWAAPSLSAANAAPITALPVACSSSRRFSGIVILPPAPPDGLEYNEIGPGLSWIRNPKTMPDVPINSVRGLE